MSSSPTTPDASSAETRTPPFRLERISRPSVTTQVLVTILSLIAALIAGGIIFLAAGENPFFVYGAMWRGAFGSLYGVSEIFVKMIPLLIVGLGVSVAFRMRLWNIGGEGQFYFGAIFATGTALFVLPAANAWIIIPAMIVAGMLGGALWASIPGLLRGHLGVNETITSLLLNYVAILFSDWLVHGPWRDETAFGFPGTEQLPMAAWLPTWGTSRVHLGLLFGVIAAVVLFFVMQRTRWGYEISVAGRNERVARYAGMATRRNIVIVMLVSGALVGLAGMAEVSGVGHQLQRNFSPGYGYTAIIVAWLGRLHPGGILVVAFLLAALLVGGDQIQITAGLPGAIAPMLQGIMLFFVLAGEFFMRYRVVRNRREERAS